MRSALQKGVMICDGATNLNRRAEFDIRLACLRKKSSGMED